MNRVIVRKLTLGAAMMALLTTAAQAQLTTFAQFTQSGGVRPFSFTNAGAASTFALNSPLNVNFVYQVLNDYNGNGFAATIPAMMTLTSDVASLGQVLGGFRNQPMTNITMTFTANTPVNGKTNLLTIVANAGGTTSGGSLFGANASSTANFAGSQNGGTGDSVTMTSDFLSFTSTTQRDYSLSLNAATPNFSLNGNGYLNSFTADGTGTFASDPAPFSSFVPEPASLVFVLLGGIALHRRCRRC